MSYKCVIFLNITQGGYQTSKYESDSPAFHMLSLAVVSIAQIKNFYFGAGRAFVLTYSYTHLHAYS